MGFHGLVNIVLPRTRLSISYFLATLSNENFDVLDVKNGNRKLMFSPFMCSSRQTRTAGVTTKAFRFVE